MILEVFLALLFFIVALNTWVTWRVVHDALSSPAQRVAQSALVWLLPMLGALLVLNLQRRNVEKGSGNYREVPDAGDDYAYSGKSFKKLEDVIDGD